MWFLFSKEHLSFLYYASYFFPIRAYYFHVRPFGNNLSIWIWTIFVYAKVHELYKNVDGTNKKKTWKIHPIYRMRKSFRILRT